MAALPFGYHADDGAAYERFLGRWTQALATRFLAFAAIPEDGPTLDLGCGTGSLALVIARQASCPVVVGLDRALPYVSFARSRAADAAVRFEVGDAAHLPHADGAFASCLAQLVFTFVAEPAAVLAEMIRVTRRGGVVAANVWDFGGGLVYQRLFWDTAAVVDPAAAALRGRLFSHGLARAGGLAALWREASLADVSERSITVRMDYAGFDDYWQPLLGGQGPVGRYVVGLRDDERARLETLVRDAYLAGAPDGSRSMTASAWAVRGVRA
ncbi:MAG: class I SAM-dependent methyltransferase [Alphaproteobacteria bacterium]